MNYKNKKYLLHFMTVFNLRGLLDFLTCFQSENLRCIYLTSTRKKSA